MNTRLKAFLKKIAGCPACKRNSAVEITPAQIPLCRPHWNRLADSNIEWGEREKT